MEYLKPLILLSLLFLSGFAQETHNLEIIWTIPGNPVLYAFGVTMAGGDVDNDGHSDIIVSADTFDENGGTTPYLGRAYLYYGNQIGDTIPDVVFKSPLAKGTTPTRVHSADINGDNYDDIIMGEDQADTGYGGVTIFWGGNPVNTVPDVILHGRSVRGAFFGCSVSSGDVNGDSFADLVVGSYGAYIRPGFDPGRVFIYFGGPSFDTIPDIILNGGHNSDREAFGRTVSGSGDVNNDGFDDIIIGAMNFDHDRGRIYIYFGGNPMDTIYDVAMAGEERGHSLGEFNVDFIKNSQTFDYAITGTPFWGPVTPPDYTPGKVYVLFGSNQMDSIPDIWMIGRTDTSSLGTWTASAGDINQDGRDEIISSAPWEGYLKGGAYVWLGGNLLDSTPDAWIKGVQYDDDIRMVASAGDIDNDGRDEIMASNYASNYTPKRVWVCKYTGQGIEERQTQKAERLTLEIYPNPTKGEIYISFPLTLSLPHQWGEDRRRGIKIFDVSGKIIREIASATLLPRNDGLGEVKVSLKGINPGIYFLRFGTETRKFLVIR
jgi:Secretion system C-terminal sorting domain/FG-GAP repeat/FG-GAP-like repeat